MKAALVKLAARVGVQDLRLAETRQRLLQRRYAERHIHGIGQPPSQHRPRRPVDDRHQIEKALPNRDVGDVCRPHLVRPVDGHVAQQIGKNLVSRLRLGGARLRRERRNPHLAHQPLHPLAIDRKAVLSEHHRHPPRAKEGPLGEQLVKPAHHRQIVVIGRRSRTVNARTRHSQQPALPAQR